MLFIASCLAVLRAWTFVYSILVSSALLPALRRRHRPNFADVLAAEMSSVMTELVNKMFVII